jgi:tRNA(Ile)-lysidine synthase
LLIQRPAAKPLTLAEFGAAIASLALFETRPFSAVAVSGGPDSLALAILADRWTRERGGELCALTVDHRLRSESGAEIRRLQDWLSARAIRHVVLAWSGEKPKSGIQEAARVARYRLLSGWCREHGCLHLLTAHHREDQIETHLIRRRAHSGADGLAGMSAIRELGDCRLLRPLLDFPKGRLLALLDAEHQPFITDPSNRNPAFERSRFRKDDGAMPAATELPALLAEIHTRGTSRVARERDGNALLARAANLHPAGFAVLDLGVLLALPHDKAQRVLSAVAATIGGALYPARRERIARLRDVLGAAACRGHTLGGCRFIHWRERVLVMRELARASEPTRLAPGESIFWDRRFNVTLPPDGATPVTIGYLGLAGVAQLNRLAPQVWRSRLPRLLSPILPAVWDDNGIAAVPHLGYRSKSARALPQFMFRPVNPLTRAGFAVV